jgi:membrane protease YdiL (CAAX protease family)
VTERPSGRLLAVGWALAFAIAAGGFFLGGELGRFALAGLGALPLAMLAVLAYVGARRGWARALTLVWLGLIVLGLLVIVVTLSMTMLGLVPGSGPAQAAPGAVGQVLEQVVGVFGIGLLGAAMLLRPVRRLVARFLPIDPGSFVHAVALAAVVSIALIGVLPLLVLGQPPVVGIEETGRDRAGQLRDQVYGLLWVLPCALAAVGYGISRDLRGALARLGLVRPTRRFVLIGLGASLGLLAFSTAVDAGIGALWGATGWPRTDTEAFAKLIAFAFTPLGALVLGVTAGLGEEVAVRGVLQPRLGILTSNLFFVALHGLQYNWDALLSVFLGGLLLGLLRRRTNTTTAAIAHGSYDFLAVVSSLLGFQ